jgi:DNA mismatch repair protein MutL
MVIRTMEPDLVAQIKAGEVIERPASVVKELLENAIDARATRIRIEVREGGVALIRVVDDGIGIPCDELALAFGEHTSSKLHSAQELGHIETLGFRGEALYAISNVSRVEAVSGLKGSNEAASVTFDHGRLISAEPAASGGGTRIAVHDIFAKVPARRKHLRSARSEAAAVHQVVAQYVVGHPHLAVSLHLDDRTALNAPGTGRIEDAFGAVYGADLVDKMLPIGHDGAIGVSGLTSPPNVTRSNRGAILIFVNGRPVRSPALIFAIEDAYSGLLMVGRHPMAAISIAVPPDHIDPNVHPAKLEVRFLSDRPVFAAVRSAVAAGLSSDSRIVEPRGSLSGKNGVDPVSALWNEPSDERYSRDQLGLGQDPPRMPYPADVNFQPQSSPESKVPSFEQALPSLRVFGQAAQTFIIAEGPSGLYMIDQHAAHERILFDELVGRSGAILRQPLLNPVRVELTAEQWTAFESHGDNLVELGFAVEPFGDRWLTIRTVPLVGAKPVAPDVLIEALDALGSARSAAEVMNGAMTVVACRAAVKAGQTLSMAEMRELVSMLEKTPNPRSCPHGRPTTIHISTERLEREFGRR